MAAIEVDRIAALLFAEAPERRIAAAIVLGELKAKSPKVLEGLCAALGSGTPPLQRHALDALERVGADKAVEAILPLCGARDAEVRDAATRALVSIGASLVPKIEARMAEAAADERRALETVLAKLGGREALDALLAGLEDAGEHEAAAAAVAMRERVRGADRAQRTSLLRQLENFLRRGAPGPRARQPSLAAQQKRKKDASVAAVKAALKMLGYLEDERATATLLEHTKPGAAPAVRQEALIALRFARGKDEKPDAKLVSALVKAAEDEDRALAQTALITLSGLPFPPQAARRLEGLLSHPDVERAGFAIDLLSQREGNDAVELLVDVLAGPDRRRAELAARALGKRKDAAGPLVSALVEAADGERARAIARALRPYVAELSSVQHKKLLEAGLAKLEAGGEWQPLLELARDVNADKTLAALRELAAKLRRNKKLDRALSVLRALCRSEHANDDDRYALTSLELTQSRKDPRREARQADDAVRHAEELLEHGYDLFAAMRRDRSVGLEEMHYLGFHFVESGHPIGEDLLREVVDKGGRSKLARAARNKLELSGAT